MNLRDIALKPECSFYSGADLAALVREAGVQSVKDLMARSETDPNAEVTVGLEHFERAFKKIRPSVSPDVSRYWLCTTRLFFLANNIIVLIIIVPLDYGYFFKMLSGLSDPNPDFLCSLFQDRKYYEEIEKKYCNT